MVALPGKRICAFIETYNSSEICQMLYLKQILVEFAVSKFSSSTQTTSCNVCCQLLFIEFGSMPAQYIVYTYECILLWTLREDVSNNKILFSKYFLKDAVLFLTCGWNNRKSSHFKLLTLITFVEAFRKENVYRESRKFIFTPTYYLIFLKLHIIYDSLVYIWYLFPLFLLLNNYHLPRL